MTLLESTVLLDEVKVVTADDDGALHLLLADDTSQNAATEIIVLQTEFIIEMELCDKRFQQIQIRFLFILRNLLARC